MDKLDLNKEFAEKLVFEQMARAERHEKRTEHDLQRLLSCDVHG